MKVDMKKNVDTHSTEFIEGVEAGLNSAEDTKNWKAGNALGRALKEEGVTEEPRSGPPVNKSPTPLFLRDGPDCRRGNAQDEKDGTEE